VLDLGCLICDQFAMNGYEEFGFIIHEFGFGLLLYISIHWTIAFFKFQIVKSPIYHFKGRPMQKLRTEYSPVLPHPRSGNFYKTSIRRTANSRY